MKNCFDCLQPLDQCICGGKKLKKKEVVSWQKTCMVDGCHEKTAVVTRSLITRCAKHCLIENPSWKEKMVDEVLAKHPEFRNADYRDAIDRADIFSIAKEFANRITVKHKSNVDKSHEPIKSDTMPDDMAIRQRDNFIQTGRN